MRVTLLAAVLSLIVPVLAVADPNVPALMAQAQRAYIAGDFDTAKDLFTQVTDVDPHNTLAIQYLRNIRIKQGPLGAVTPAKDPLKALILPRVELKEATFSAALNFFKDQASRQSISISFVSKLPEPQMDRKVTLSLSSIPFLEALRYLCELDNATYKQERYAIVIVPKTSDAAPSDSPAQ